jgi:hypothetical protein
VLEDELKAEVKCVKIVDRFEQLRESITCEVKKYQFLTQP